MAVNLFSIVARSKKERTNFTIFFGQIIILDTEDNKLRYNINKNATRFYIGVCLFWWAIISIGGLIYYNYFFKLNLNLNYTLDFLKAKYRLSLTDQEGALLFAAVIFEATLNNP